MGRSGIRNLTVMHIINLSCPLSYIVMNLLTVIHNMIYRLILVDLPWGYAFSIRDTYGYKWNWNHYTCMWSLYLSTKKYCNYYCYSHKGIKANALAQKIIYSKNLQKWKSQFLNTKYVFKLNAATIKNFKTWKIMSTRIWHLPDDDFTSFINE